MKKSTVVLAIAAICMLAVIGCKNAAVTPPVTSQDPKPTTVLSARFTDANKTYDFSLEKPAANSAVVSGKLYSQDLNKAFSLKGVVDAVSGDFTLSMRSSAAGIHADVTGNTENTEGLTLKVSMKEGNKWANATQITLDTTSIKTGTAAVEVTGTVDPAAQDVSLPDEMLGTWKMYPAYYKIKPSQQGGGGASEHKELSISNTMGAVVTEVKISHPYYASKFSRSDKWYLFNEETAEGKKTIRWYPKGIPESSEIEATGWEQYIAGLSYYSMEDNPDYMVTLQATVYPFEALLNTGIIENISNVVTTEELKERHNYKMSLSFIKVIKNQNGYDVIPKSSSDDSYVKLNYKLTDNGLKAWYYDGAWSTLEEASLVTEPSIYEPCADVLTR